MRKTNIFIIVIFSILQASLWAENNEKSGDTAEGVVIVSSTTGDDFIKLAARIYSEMRKDVRLRLKKVPEDAGRASMKDGSAALMVAADAVPEAGTLLRVYRPFTVSVNSENPLTQISSQQLRRVFAGELLSWSELGGTDSPIRLVLYTRPEKKIEKACADKSCGHDHSHDHAAVSGLERNLDPDAAALDALLPSRRPGHKYFLEAGSSRGIAALVASDRNAVGCFPLEYDNGQVKHLKIDGFMPTSDNLASGKYPLSVRTVVMISPKASSEARDFAKFLKSKECESIYRYLSLTPVFGGER